MASLSDEHLADRFDDPPGGRRRASASRSAGWLGQLLRLPNPARLLRFRSSALARRIITINLIALSVMLLGMMYLNQFRGGILEQHQKSMILESELVAEVISTQIGTPSLDGIPLSAGETAQLFSDSQTLISEASVDGSGSFSDTIISDWLERTKVWLRGLFPGERVDDLPTHQEFLDAMVEEGLSGSNLIRRATIDDGTSVLAVVRSVRTTDGSQHILLISTQHGYLDQLVRGEQESMLRLFALAFVVSVILSAVLANTIANPIHDLTSAAELGATRKGRQGQSQRIRIPDFSGRPDEIGRLSNAMRDMTAALYHRIDTNEEFAADVAHEIKNPLASLRSAVETLRITKDGKGRTKLLDVIEHDVRRLDRLVSDISNASRLDAELVKEEMDDFDLTRALERIVDFHTPEANERGTELLWVPPKKPIMIDGLEDRLAQVFVNLISNAISFTGEGDAVRVWARERDGRALVVVEDTGPGIPEEALTRIFERFYSEREESDYGNNSGLGLAISKQIVEAHSGVIWAENIHADQADPDGPSLGARFVVGLPV